jgi:meiotically up-regulated gene 157 (Mug157) protein
MSTGIRKLAKLAGVSVSTVSKALNGYPDIGEETKQKILKLANCDSNDPVWRHTMEFAFTSANEGGFYDGAYAGLGSVHTPHPWPLGDAQELLFRWLSQDEARRDNVLAKLLRIVQWDGLFSEAVNENTGVVESRHWFSWPGAFISTVLIETAER